MPTRKVNAQIDQAFNDSVLGRTWNSLGRTARNWVVFGAGFATYAVLSRFGFDILSFLVGHGN